MDQHGVARGPVQIIRTFNELRPKRVPFQAHGVIFGRNVAPANQEIPPFWNGVEVLNEFPVHHMGPDGVRDSAREDLDSGPKRAQQIDPHRGV